ncbi:MAG: hypothetical protein EA425_00750, partial [Puniceicoccaceae bacterium]
KGRQFLEAALAEWETRSPGDLPSPAHHKAAAPAAPSALQRELRAKKKLPPTAFLDTFEQLAGLLDLWLRHLRLELLELVRLRLPAKTALRRTLTFDDLLVRLHQALEGPQGSTLAARIGDRFDAALIDEFQDTDPVQYAIFHRLFAGGRHRLFLIGDPKQAIYGFRGADLFTYLRAAREADQRQLLAENWRSLPPLVSAVNSLFSRHPDTFLEDAIAFVPSGSAPREWPPPPEGTPPLHCLLIPAPGDKKFRADQVAAHLRHALAAEILRLLRQAPDLEPGRPLRAGDCAILVRRREEARQLRRFLLDLRIPCVLQTDESVFESPEARDFLTVLAALVHPHREDFRKAAATTPLFGWPAHRLDGSAADNPALAELLESFRRHRRTWEAHGFMPCFRQLLLHENAHRRLAALPDGERALTNWLHLAELLHQAESTRHLGPEGLLRWLHDNLENPRRDSTEDSLVRLERDDDAVHILTIHASKGLQFPVVFCPYLWTGIAPPPNPLLVHDPASDHSLLVDLHPRPSEGLLHLRTREDLAEAVRLAYVALTRARNRCVLAVPEYAPRAPSALGWIIGRETAGGNPDAGANSQIHAGLAHLAACHPETMLYSELGDISAPPEPLPPASDPGAGPPAPRVFQARPAPSFRLASFTAWTSESSRELPDHQDPSLPTAAATETGPPLAGPLAEFTPGARTGELIHLLLERADLSNPLSWPAALDRVARGFQLPSREQESLGRFLDHLARHPIAFAGEPLSLSQVPPEATWREWAFTLPQSGITPRDLAGALADCPDLPGGAAFVDRIRRLGFIPSAGYLTGFIDFIFRHDGRFHLVDWKSNHLGGTAAAYDHPGLLAAMQEHLYLLQLVLYSAALDRFLSTFVSGFNYERDFGGAAYLFVRGLDPAMPARGCFTWKPPASLLRRLGALFVPAP